MTKRSFDTMNNFYSSSYEEQYDDALMYPPPEPFRARCRVLDQEDSY